MGLCLGNQPTYGPNGREKLQYNDPVFEPMWSLIEETGLVITFHVSTGKDPRAVGGNGGAIINYVCHSMETTIEPLVQLRELPRRPVAWSLRWPVCAPQDRQGDPRRRFRRC